MNLEICILAAQNTMSHFRWWWIILKQSDLVILLVWEEGKAGVLESLKGKKENINNRLGLPPTPPQTWNV